MNTYTKREFLIFSLKHFLPKRSKFILQKLDLLQQQKVTPRSKKKFITIELQFSRYLNSFFPLFYIHFKAINVQIIMPIKI